MTQYLAIFKNGTGQFANYAYFFEVWTSKRCCNFFKKEFEPGFYFVMPQGVFQVRGTYETHEAAKESAKQWLLPEDEAVLSEIVEYINQHHIPIMNLDF
jgi:hypothetical protein